MPNGDRPVRVAGAWLAIASLLMIVVLGLHGPIAPDLHDQMTRIADAAVRWSVVHWIAAAALSLFVVSGLIVLTSGSRLTDGWWTLTAWAVVCVGCLWTMTTAVAEATIIAEAAVAGSETTFLAWWAFAEGKAHGFAFFALAVAVIAGSEARHAAGAVSAPASWVGAGAGVASFCGWALGMWFGIAAGNLLWVVSSLVMSLWTFWFGVIMMRTPAQQQRTYESPPRQPEESRREARV